MFKRAINQLAVMRFIKIIRKHCIVRTLLEIKPIAQYFRDEDNS